MFSKTFVIHIFEHRNLIFFRFAVILFFEVFLLGSAGISNPVPVIATGKEIHRQDTIFIRKGRYILLKNTSITIPRDTFYILKQKNRNRNDTGSFRNSQIFYDSVYKKFSRNKVTQLLYYLAFVVPKQSDLPDTLQVLKSTIPFDKYRGKVIRDINVKILPPFGVSVYDTGRYAVRGIGNALNSVHMNTRRYVVRRNLLFKKGDRVNSSILADNERLLRNIPAIDDARIIVMPTEPGSDSVDLLIVAKDIWSIGLDVPLITPQQVRLRVYDVNFLGLGDQLTTNMSIHTNRAPFYLFESLSYSFSNIGGSLINASIGYNTDHSGNRILLFRIDRQFLTNMTKWAGGAAFALETRSDKITDNYSIKSDVNNEGLWLGRAFLLNRQNEASRAVIASAVYRRDFTSRPAVTIDSNRGYYRQLQVLTTLSISNSNHYLTDYIRDFGKTENLPYGHLVQLTAGVDQTEFYTRFYSGFHLSAGRFFDRFGYLSGYLKFGGFLNHSSFEDAVVKINLNYFTPLLKTRDKRYKFRTFFSAAYRYAINSRSNNNEYYNANMDFHINKIGDADYFNTANVVSARLSTVCYFPWYYYGFRFAIMMELQAGLASQKQDPLYKTPLFNGIGLSLVIKNDNLIFPAFLITGYLYPFPSGNYRQLQFNLGSNMHVQYYDFNVSAPHEENLGN